MIPPLRLRYLVHGIGYIDGCRCWSCRLGWWSAGREFRQRVLADSRDESQPPAHSSGGVS